MSRFQRPQREDPNAWLLTIVDDDGNQTGPAYNPKIDPLSDEYRSIWIMDYRAIVAQEERDFPRRATRIDLVETEYGPAKRTWLAGWMPEDPPAKYGPLAAGWTIASAADHLEAQGWKVRRWEGGARAWRINLRPVRRFRRIEYTKELLRKQGRKNLSNDTLLFDYPA